jgi:hypothetical protein
MKAYQVFKVSESFNGRQYDDLIATYLSRYKAILHCIQLVIEEETIGNKLILEHRTEDDEDIVWGIKDGYEYTEIVKFREIDITQ